MDRETFITQGYVIVEGRKPYLAIITVPERVLKEEYAWEKFLDKYNNCYIHKLFVQQEKVIDMKMLIQDIQEKHNISSDHIIIQQYEPMDLIQYILEKTYKENINIDIKTTYYNSKLQAVVTTNLNQIEYAFYIKHDKKILVKKDYSVENYIEYSVNTQLGYSIIVFINTEFGKLIFSREIENTEMDLSKLFILDQTKKLYIHGSCVSRDIFNFGDVSKMKLSGYAARQSLFAVFSPPLEEIDGFEPRLQSNFQKRMLMNDCTKNLWEEMCQSDAQYLIIDFIDTIRFPIFKRNNSKITGSTEFLESGLSEALKFERINITTFRAEWKDYIEQYIDKILERFREENIIIHCAYYKYFYRDNQNRLKIFPQKDIVKYRQMNRNLKYLYESLKERLPKACYINICKKVNYIADAKHHFGLSPVHYTEKYYLEVKKRIEALKND